MRKKRVRRNGMPSVVVWAIGEFTKARMLSDVDGYVKVGVGFLELDLN